jgi:putative mycofactocin binding protein MftB
VRGLLIVSAPAQERGVTQSDGPGAFDPDHAWQLHPQVAIRPEPFGALLYHFGTRKLSFLKNRTILAVVQSLADYPDVRAACRAAGVDDSEQGPYLHALGVLARSSMLVPTDPKEAA